MTRIVQEKESAVAVVDLDAGCRLASLIVEGQELLVTAPAASIDWGLYPMAPWAGRIRNGRFDFDGVTYRLPRNFGNHAIHGTVFDRGWTRESDTSFTCPLGAPWPFPGVVRQEIVLHEDRLDLRLEVQADVSQPVTAGWHPWFRRVIGGSSGRLDFDPGFMLVRDGEGIPTGERVPPPPGPWDDCFGGLRDAPTITWPGWLTLRLVSPCPYWVVYDERPHAICIEPQTGPPDAVNLEPVIVEGGSGLVATASLAWERHHDRQPIPSPLP